MSKIVVKNLTVQVVLRKQGLHEFLIGVLNQFRERLKSPISALCKAAEWEAHIPFGKEGLLK